MDLGVLRLWDVRKEAGVSVDRLYSIERTLRSLPKIAISAIFFVGLNNHLHL
jgi:hypothetical protein